MSGLDEVYVSWESTVYPDGGMCVSGAGQAGLCCPAVLLSVAGRV